MTRFVTVTCPECRATEAEPLDEEHYRCRHCRSTFLREKAQRPGPGPAPPLQHRRAGVGVGGAVGLLAAGLLIGGVLVQRSRRPISPRPITGPGPAPVPKAPLPPRRSVVAPVPEGKEPRVDLKEVRAGRTSIGGAFWLVRYANVGEVTVERPAVVVSLFDAAGKRVEEQSGWAPVQRLAPAEESPVLVLISRPPAYVRAEIVPRRPQAERYGARQVRLQIKEQTMRDEGHGRSALIGTVRNPTAQALRFTQIVVSGRDAQGSLASYATGIATQGGLQPSGESGFKVHLGTFHIGAPVRYDVMAFGTY